MSPARLAAAALLAACTAPPLGHPYQPIAVDNAWEYTGHLISPTSSGGRRSAVAITEVTREAGHVRALVERSIATGPLNHISGGSEAWILDPAGLQPAGPPGTVSSGLALPLNLATAAPWSGEATWPTGEVLTVHAEVVGRRTLTVPAGTFTTIVVRSDMTMTHPNAPTEHYIFTRDLACGVGEVRTVAVNVDASDGFEAQLEHTNLDPDAGRGCAAENLGHLPLYGAAEVSAFAARRCDLAALELLARDLDESPSVALRDAVPSRLAAACVDALPPSIAAYVTTGDSGLAFAVDPATDAWIDRACPSQDTAARARLLGRDTVLQPEVQDACRLDDLGLAARDELTDVGATLIPWALDRLLRAQDLAPASARSIVRALLARDRRLLGPVPKDIRLPTGGGHDVADALLLTLSPTAVNHRNATIPLTGERRFAAASLDLLRIELDRSKLIASIIGSDEDTPRTRDFAIAADLDVAPATLIETLLEVAAADLHATSLLLEGVDGRLHGLRLAAFTWQTIDPAGDDDAPEMTLRLRGPWIEAGEHRRDTIRDRRSADPRFFAATDLAGLRAHAEAFKLTHPRAHRLVVTIDDDAALSDLIALLTAIRGRDCDATATCLLPTALLRAIAD